MATLVAVSQGPNRIKDGAVEGMVDNPVIGAVNRILPHPTDSNIMYIGSVNGGVWRTTNAKSSNPTWTPLTDNLYSTSIGALAFVTYDASYNDASYNPIPPYNTIPYNDAFISRDASYNTIPYNDASYNPIPYNTIIAGIGRTSALAFRGGALSGLQILDTTDGTTFTTTEVRKLRGLNITGVVKHNRTIVVSVDKADTATYANYGVFRSEDNGFTFTRVTSIPNGRAADMVVDPTNPSTIYVAIYNFESKLSGHVGVGGYGGVYKSTDRGKTWTKKSNTAIDDAIREHTKNIKLAVSKDNRVYVAISVGESPASKGELRAIFRSQNGGDSWPQNGGDSWSSLLLPTTTENGVPYGIHPGGQGFVHFSFEADPDNSDIIYIGGDRQPSSFGGTNRNIMPSRYYTPGASDTPNPDLTFPNSIGADTFSGRLFRGTVTPGTSTCAWVHLTHSNTLGATGGGTANNSAPHADSRDMAFDASGNLIECDDGGIYRRTFPQTNSGDWISMNGNLQVTEIHSIVYDSVTKLITAGTQDNGTILLVNPHSSSEPKIWKKISQGDGAVVCVDKLLSPPLLYYSSQNLLNFRRVDASGNSYKLDVEQNPVEEMKKVVKLESSNSTFRPQFYTPIKANSVEGGRLLLACADSVYESLDKGDTLTKIGTSLMTLCSCIVYGGKKGATLCPDLVYACKGHRVFLRSPGSSPTSFVSRNPFLSTHKYSRIVDISVDPRDWERAFIVSVSPNPLSSGQMSQVHMTTDAGVNWIDITGTLATRDIGEIWTCDLIRKTDDTLCGLVVGTEAGVWVVKLISINKAVTVIAKAAAASAAKEAAERLQLATAAAKEAAARAKVAAETTAEQSGTVADNIAAVVAAEKATAAATAAEAAAADATAAAAAATTANNEKNTVLSELWEKVGPQIPNAQVTDIDYNPTDDILVVGTLGRGAWSITGLNTIYPPPTSGAGSAFEEEPLEPEVPIPVYVYPNRISSMVLRVTQGTNIYEEQIILPSESATSLGTKSINISNTTLINTINNSQSGTIFCPEIVTTYDAGTHTVRAYGSPFVTP